MAGPRSPKFIAEVVPRSAKESHYISNYERRIRIERLLEIKGWSWYRLSEEMNKKQGGVARALKTEEVNCKRDVRLKMLTSCAIAFGISIGFLTDRHPASMQANQRGKK